MVGNSSQSDKLLKEGTRGRHKKTWTGFPSRLTGCTPSAGRRWPCGGCKSGSPGRYESLQSGRPLPLGRSRRSAPTAETPGGTWPVSQRTWKEKQSWEVQCWEVRCQTSGFVPAKHRVQLLGDVVVSVFDFLLAQSENNVRVRFPVRVSRVQV